MKKYKLGEVLTISSTSITPQAGRTYHLYSLPSFDDGKVPEIIKGENIQSNKYVISNRCILFNKLNVRFKRIWRIENNTPNKLCSTEFLPLIIDESIIDYQYCYYLLASDYLTNYLCGINSNTSGSHKRINPDILLNLEVTLPVLDEQKRIGSILANLDRKIALNHSINHNLEAMAKQLYDYWFLQFDFPDENGKPYKSSGGKMAWNEKLKREIPEGWECDFIKNIATTYSGGTPKSTNKEYYNNGTIAWINSGELNNTIITKASNYITESGLNNSSAKLYPDNSILVAMYGATAGKVSLLTFEACSNQAVCGVIPVMERMQHYVFLYLSSLYNQFITLSIGSARDNISQETIKNILIPIPTTEVLLIFENKVREIYQTIVEKNKQVNTLITLRDSLLPLLMNGQVSLNYDLAVLSQKVCKSQRSYSGTKKAVR